VETCGFCGWSFPKMKTPCAHAVRGPLFLLSPPHVRRVVPSVVDRECLCGLRHTTITAYSVMPWPTRRWITFHVEPEESDSIVAGRNAHLADAARRCPRVQDWGRHADPSKSLPLHGVRGDDCDCGILHLQPADVLTWCRLHARELLWDDSERRGRMPSRRRVGSNVGNATGEDGMIDPTKLLHPRWREHMKALPLDEHAYCAYRRRLREVSWRSLSAPPTPTAKKLPKYPFKASDLSKEPLGTKYLGEYLSPAERPWIDEELDALQIRHVYRAVGHDGADEYTNEREGGRARRLGAHKAEQLLARRHALERVEADVDARLAGHHDASTAAKADLEKLIDTINDAAQRLPDKDIFDAVNCLLNARDSNGELGETESVLVSMADQWRIKTDVARRVLAYQLATAFRKPLRPWATGRTGRDAWVPPVLPAARSVAMDAFDALFEPKRDGRPPDHDPQLVALALFLAVGIYHRLERGLGDEGVGLAAIEGYWRDRWPPEGIALALLAATTAEVSDRHVTFEGRPETMPRYLNKAELDEIVARVGYGRPGACRALAFEVAALAYNLPRKALEAMVKRTK
jgi:hypothetical protein